MKIGVLTFHRCINYGSYWQARCLAEGLRGRGHDVVILDHASRRVDLAEWKCAFRPTGAERPADRRGYRQKIRRFFHAFATLPLSPPIALDTPRAAPVEPAGCDAVVVGSDEVWNLSHPWYGGVPLFYGEGLRTPHLVAYAASFGHHEAPGGLPEPWSARLRNFTRIAVRDDHSRAVVRDATGVAPPVVLDPCLQFPPAVPDGEDAPVRGPYAAVYGHGFSDGFIEQARRWAGRAGLPLLSVGYRNDWADHQWLGAGPQEFARAIAGARAVATNFFHGCVFALRHERPFACETTWYRGNKLRGLMAQVGGERHLVGPATTPDAFGALLDAPPDPRVAARIGRLRAHSAAYLDHALPRAA